MMSINLAGLCVASVVLLLGPAPYCLLPLFLLSSYSLPHFFFLPPPPSPPTSSLSPSPPLLFHLFSPLLFLCPAGSLVSGSFLKLTVLSRAAKPLTFDAVRGCRGDLANPLTFGLYVSKLVNPRWGGGGLKGKREREKERQ